LAGHAGFGRGEVDTGLIARDIDALTAVPEIEARHWAHAGMAALGVLDAGVETGFTLWAPLRRQVMMSAGDEERLLKVEISGPDHQTWFVGEDVVEARRVAGRWSVGGVLAADVAVAGAVVTVFEGYGLRFEVVDPLDRAAGAQGDGNVIEAPMPGLVRVVDARVGQAVAKGDRLAVLEAMKMEHALLAARDGIVAEVLAATGDQVEAGAALVRLEAEADVEVAA
jgi:3-methylcrotonyl-CoA carboxylase alpha subunit